MGSRPHPKAGWQAPLPRLLGPGGLGQPLRLPTARSFVSLSILLVEGRALRSAAPFLVPHNWSRLPRSPLLRLECCVECGGSFRIVDIPRGFWSVRRSARTEREPPYSRNTPRKDGPSGAGANDGRSTPEEEIASRLRAFVSSHPTLAPKEQAGRRVVKSSAFTGRLSVFWTSSADLRR